MRRFLVEIAVVFVLAAVSGIVVARGLIVTPTLQVVRAGGESLPPRVVLTGAPVDDRHVIALSSLLDSVRSPPTTDAGSTPPRSGTQPSVRREGGAVHIDLHGAEPNADVLAGAELVPRDPSAGGGYLVRSLDHAGLLAAAGVVVGDVVVAVNDMPTRTADESLAAFAIARTSPSATLRLERAGRTFEVVADLVR